MEEKLGSKYVEGRSVDFEVSYQESGPATPVFFVLSPGVDPLKDVEALGKKLGFTFNAQNFHNVSLGQVRVCVCVCVCVCECVCGCGCGCGCGCVYIHRVVLEGISI